MGYCHDMNLRSHFFAFPPDEGTRCWVSNAHTMRPLPEGLEDRTPVIYRGRHPDIPTLAIVETEDGRRWEIAHNQYEMPLFWDVDGEWLPEDDHRTLQKLRDYIEWLKLDPCDPAIVPDREAAIERIEWIIQRNGAVL
jgi:hypothetical protein